MAGVLYRRVFLLFTRGSGFFFIPNLSPLVALFIYTKSLLRGLRRIPIHYLLIAFARSYRFSRARVQASQLSSISTDPRLRSGERAHRKSRANMHDALSLSLSRNFRARALGVAERRTRRNFSQPPLSRIYPYSTYTGYSFSHIHIHVSFCRCY